MDASLALSTMLYSPLMVGFPRMLCIYPPESCDDFSGLLSYFSPRILSSIIHCPPPSHFPAQKLSPFSQSPQNAIYRDALFFLFMLCGRCGRAFGRQLKVLKLQFHCLDTLHLQGFFKGLWITFWGRKLPFNIIPSLDTQPVSVGNIWAKLGSVLLDSADYGKLTTMCINHPNVCTILNVFFFFF